MILQTGDGIYDMLFVISDTLPKECGSNEDVLCKSL